MRILAVTDAEPWFHYHVVGSLIDQCHHVETFTYGAGSGDFYGRSRQAERLTGNQCLLDHAQRMIADGGLDLIFCYVYDDFLMVEYARKLAALGVPMVNYNVDMHTQWYRQIRIAPYFTLMLCAHRANMDNLARYGGRVLYFPMASRPRPVEAQTDVVPAAPVTFVGTPMDYRIRVLATVQRAGIPLAIYGRLWGEDRVSRPEYSWEKTVSDLYRYAWPRLRGEGLESLVEAFRSRFFGLKGAVAETVEESSTHGAVPGGALNDLFRRSRINLGITRMTGDDPDKPGVNQVKLRDFEVPLAGGFYLVEEADEHKELFTIGKEIETWRNTDELVEKIRYYLANDDRRVSIANAGQARVLAQHTWQARFDLLFRKLSLV